MTRNGLIVQWFRVPGNWDDNASLRRAEVLHIAHLFMFFGGFLYLIVPPSILNGEPSHVLGSMAIAAIGSALLRTGWLKMSGAWTTGALWLVFTAGSLTEGGITSGSFAGTLAMVVFAGLTYGVVASAAISVMSVIAGAGLVYLKHNQLMPPQTLIYTDLNILSDFTIYITATCLFTAVAIRRIEKSTARSESELAERRRAEEALRESEDLYRTLIGASPDPISVTNLDGVLIYASSQAIRTFGYSSLAEVVSHSILEWVAPEERQKATANIRSLLVGESFVEHEYTLIRKDGTRFVGEINAGIYRSADGKPKGMIIVTRDITERRRAIESLSESEDRFRSLYENAAIGIYRTTPDGQIIMANPAAVGMLGYSSFEELAGRNLEQTGFEPSYDRREFKRRIEHDGVVTGLEEAWTRKDGTTIFVRESAKAVRNNKGDILYYDGTFEDITARKRAEEALHISHATYEGILNSVSEMVYIQNERGIFLDVNRAAENIYGYPRDFFIGKAPDFLSAPGRNNLDEIGAKIHKAFNGERQTFEFWGMKKDGTVFPKDVSLTPGSYFGEKAIIAVARDITGRKQAEEALLKSERANRAIVDSVPDLLLRVSSIGVLLGYRGPSDSELYAPPEVFLGKKLEEVLPPDVSTPALAAVSKVLETRKLVSFEYKLEVRNVLKFYEARFVPLSEDEVLLVIRDVTTRKLAEERLMASLREKEILLKEVHHRVKNNMQVISSLLSIQALEIQDEEMKSLFRESQSRVRSMALVHEKLYRSEDMARIDFGEYVHSMVAELKHASFREGVECSVKADRLIMGIDSAIPCGLIVHELMTNALKHAFRNRETGAITVCLHRREGNLVDIVVEDNGVGIPADMDIHRMTSMGMTVILSLAQQLNGSVTLDRSGGSRFTLTFPI